MNKNSSQQNVIICNWCGVQTKIIWVHGHGQCANCGINIEECCKGETCDPELLNKKNENNSGELHTS
ncbi:MAG: hypothetical protein A2068_00175 [Ignavibacteria bacterium GWB2_35_6b]|nr:MAG: hypothetical protein A2068_00175 [Ignavibacteria bacterium GWB2_35_6b]